MRNSISFPEKENVSSPEGYRAKSYMPKPKLEVLKTGGFMNSLSPERSISNMAKPLAEYQKVKFIKRISNYNIMLKTEKLILNFICFNSFKKFIFHRFDNCNI